MLARFRTSALAVTIGAAALALPLSLAVPAEAAAAGNGGGRGSTSALPGAPSVINNPTFAGYQARVASGSATSSAAQFKVPRLSCTATAADRVISPAAGVVVNNFGSESSARLFAVCHRGRALYLPALDINGNELAYAP